MIKSLVLAGCGTLALAASADAAVHHHRHHIAGYHGNQPAEVGGARAIGGHAGYPTAFRLPQQPLIWDCVHVVFPQCDRGFDGLNDGSYK